MLSLLADENVDPAIIAQLRLHIPNVDFLHVRDVNHAQTPDEIILEWAANNGGIVVTHDKSAMRHSAEVRLRDGLPMLGLFILQDNDPVGVKIQGLIRLVNNYEIEFYGPIVFI